MNQLSGSIHYRLQPAILIGWYTGKSGIPVVQPKATGVKQSIASSLEGCATHWRNGEWSDGKLRVFGKACHMFSLCFRLKY